MVTKWSGHINIVIIRAVHGSVQVGFVPNLESTCQIQVTEKLTRPQSWKPQVELVSVWVSGNLFWVKTDEEQRWRSRRISLKSGRILMDLDEIWPDLHLEIGGGRSSWLDSIFSCEDPPIGSPYSVFENGNLPLTSRASFSPGQTV